MKTCHEHIPKIYCTNPRLVEALFFIYYFGFPFFIFSIDDQSCSTATVNGLSGKTKTKASAASTAASVPRKLDQPQDLTVPDIVTWLPVLLTASSTSTQGKLLKSVDNCGAKGNWSPSLHLHIFGNFGFGFFVTLIE